MTDTKTQRAERDSGTVPALVVPSRLRLFIACLILSVIAISDPLYVASIIALGNDEMRKLAKKRKAEILCGPNPGVHLSDGASPDVKCATRCSHS